VIELLYNKLDIERVKDMPIPTEKVYRGSGRPAVIYKRDKSLISDVIRTRPPVADVIVTYLNTEKSQQHAIDLFVAMMDERLSH
jgi:hypothetical protein